MVFAIENKLVSPRQLSQSVLQITEMLGLYQAELARILHLQCGDIGALASAKSVLDEQSESWQYALAFVQFYQALYTYCDGEGAAMCNWLRREHAGLNKTPLLTMVDDLNIENVIRLLK